MCTPPRAASSCTHAVYFNLLAWFYRCANHIRSHKSFVCYGGNIYVMSDEQLSEDGSQSGDTDEPEWEQYTTMVAPVGTESTAPNAIVEIELSVPGPSGRGGPGGKSTVEPDFLGVIADVLAEQGAHELSARVEITRQRAVDVSRHQEHATDDDSSHPTIQFTAATLTDIAVLLAIALTEAVYADNEAVINAVSLFGQLIDSHVDAPMSEAAEFELPGIEPVEGSYIDPFKVIARQQNCRLLQQS